MSIKKTFQWILLLALFGCGIQQNFARPITDSVKKQKQRKKLKKVPVSQDPIIHYDENGKLYGELPQKLFSTQKLHFYISGTKDPMDAFKKKLTDKATNAALNIKLLLKDDAQMFVLNTVYGITKKELQKVAADCDSIQKSPNTKPVHNYLPYFNPKDYCYSVKLSPSAQPVVTFPFNTVSDGRKCTVIGDGKSLTFSLSMDDSYKKKVFEWFKDSTKNNFAVPITQENLAEWKSSITEVNQALKVVTALLAKKRLDNKTFYNDLIGQLKAEEDNVSALNDKIKLSVSAKLKGDKGWLLKWLWYQPKGIPVLNPFNFVTDERLGDKPDTTANVALRMKIETRISFIKAVDYTKTPTATVDKYVTEIDHYRQKIAANTKALTNYQTLAANNEKYKNDFAQTTTVLNNGLLFVSYKSPEEIYWMRHHNAADDNQLMSVGEQTEYLEDDRVVIITHNLEQNIHASVNLSYADIASANSVFGDGVLDATRGLTYILSADVHARQDTSMTATDLLKQLKNDYANELKNLQANLDTLKKYNLCLKYLVQQQNPVTDLTENPDKDPVYHSEKLQTPAIAGNKAATYTIKVGTTDAIAPAANDAAKTTTTTTVTGAVTTTAVTTAAIAGNAAMPVDTFKFRVNKKYRIFPMAGLAYTTNRFSDVASSSDGNSAGKITTENQMRVIAGLKFFIEKTDIRNTKFLFGRDEYGQSLFWTRTHIDAAVGVTDPLNNIYAGGGFDLWPGLDLSCGVVFNKYTYNVYSGGQNTVNQQLYRPGFYVALSTDVAVVAELLKLLNIGK